MRLYMEDNKLPYAVRYISDPLCWTEVPVSYKILWRQRDRWTRGTVETLWKHRKMFFNSKYRVLGLLSYPYWFFFELFAPIIEFTGWMFFIVYAVLQIIEWRFYFLLLLFIICFGYLFSTFSILIETFTFRQYKEKYDVPKLLVAIGVEPFIFHLYVVGAAIRGILKMLLSENSGWGEMTRGGFVKKESTKNRNGYS